MLNFLLVKKVKQKMKHEIPNLKQFPMIQIPMFKTSSQMLKSKGQFKSFEHSIFEFCFNFVAVLRDVNIPLYLNHLSTVFIPVVTSVS